MRKMGFLDQGILRLEITVVLKGMKIEIEGFLGMYLTGSYLTSYLSGWYTMDMPLPKQWRELVRSRREC